MLTFIKLVWVLLLPALLLVLLTEAFLLGLLWHYMKQATYPAPLLALGKSPLTWVLVPWNAWRQVRREAVVWYAEKAHWLVAAAAIGVVIGSFKLAWRTLDCLDFARAGSLIVLLGFTSIFVGLYHHEGISRARELLFEEIEPIPPVSISESSHAARRSNRWVFIVTALGTLIWGYGDLLLKQLSSLLPFACH